MKNVNQYVMKDSGVQWIGQVPEHWEVCKVKNICTYVNRGCTPNYVENGTYYAMNQATFSKGFLDYSSLKFTTENRKSAQVLKQDILLASTGGGVLGKVWYYNDDVDLFYAVADVIILRVNPKEIDARYLYYDLSIKYQLMNALFVNGSTNQIHLQRDLLKNHYIQCPPLSEQRAIADWLDAKCSDIDAAIELQQRMIDKLKAYKTAVIHQAVTKGLDKNLKPRDLKDSGIKWLGMIPKHWDILRAKNIFVRKNRLVREEDETITCFRDGQVTLRKNRRSDGFTEAVKEIGYQGVRIGDLVIHQMDAFAGAIGVSDSDGKSSPVYICLRPKIENCINQYYAYLLREMARAGFIRALYRGIRERSTDFRFETFANVSLPVPTLEEQRDIIDYIDAKCADIDATIALKEQKQEKLKAYKKTIIFEYVTGKKQVANINK